MKKYTLLSHGWQKTGLALLAFCALLSVVCFKAIVHDLLLVNSYYGYDSFGSGWAATALVLCFTVGVVLLALSRERAEDERVSAIRHQSLIGTVILYVAIVFLSALSNLFLFHYCSLEKVGQIVTVRRLLTCVPMFILYYVLIFKVSLWLDNKRLGDEE